MLVWLENGYSRPFLGIFLSHFPHMMSLIVLSPKRTILRLNHVIWAKNRENRSRGSSWTCKREKRQDRTLQDRKKVTKGLYFTYLWRSPIKAMYIKICVVGHALDVITYAKFQNEIFRGYNFRGGRIFHFSYWFWIGLTTVQRYCAACDNHTYGSARTTTKVNKNGNIWPVPNPLTDWRKNSHRSWRRW